MDETTRYYNALSFAAEKHKGQFRLGGEEYITHPIEVSNIIKDWGLGIDYQITALFHDLLEDTNATHEEIIKYGNQDILSAVILLSKEENFVMEEYIQRIRGNEMAFRVKAADRLHNVRSALVTTPEFKRHYIQDTRTWYMDFCPEIPTALDQLAASLDSSYL